MGNNPCAPEMSCLETDANIDSEQAERAERVGNLSVNHSDAISTLPSTSSPSSNRKKIFYSTMDPESYSQTEALEDICSIIQHSLITEHIVTYLFDPLIRMDGVFVHRTVCGIEQITVRNTGVVYTRNVPRSYGEMVESCFGCFEIHVRTNFRTAVYMEPQLHGPDAHLDLSSEEETPPFPEVDPRDNSPSPRLVHVEAALISLLNFSIFPPSLGLLAKESPYQVHPASESLASLAAFPPKPQITLYLLSPQVLRSLPAPLRSVTDAFLARSTLTTAVSHTTPAVELWGDIQQKVMELVSSPASTLSAAGTEANSSLDANLSVKRVNLPSPLASRHCIEALLQLCQQEPASTRGGVFRFDEFSRKPRKKPVVVNPAKAIMLQLDAEKEDSESSDED